MTVRKRHWSWWVLSSYNPAQVVGTITYNPAQVVGTIAYNPAQVVGTTRYREKRQ